MTENEFWMLLATLLLTTMFVAPMAISAWVDERIRVLEKLTRAGWDEAANGTIIRLEPESWTPKRVNNYLNPGVANYINNASYIDDMIDFLTLYPRKFRQARRYSQAQLDFLSNLAFDSRSSVDIARDIAKQFQ